MHFFFAKNPIQISRRAKRGGQSALAKSFLAGAPGLEPGNLLLERSSLPLAYAPHYLKRRGSCLAVNNTILGQIGQLFGLLCAGCFSCTICPDFVQCKALITKSRILDLSRCQKHREFSIS